MSTGDLRGRNARVDRSDALTGLLKEAGLFRPRRVVATWFLLAPLLLAPFLWLRSDDTQSVAKIYARGVPYVEAVPGIPLHVNDRVEHWMEEFQTTRREEFQEMLERRGVFEDIILAKLRSRGMPEEILTLAMIESGYTPLAESRASAVGMWQFMSPTAVQFGLRVDEYVDERRDPVRATDAALDYLEYLHARFGSWYLAAAAYNAGASRVERILELHADGRKGDEDLYWEVLAHLPRETRDYVPRLVAMTILANDAGERGFAPSGAESYQYDVVFFPGRTDLRQVARSLDVDVGVLRDLNPHLIRDVTPPDEMYGVRVPKGGIPIVMASLGQRPAERGLAD